MANFKLAILAESGGFFITRAKRKVKPCVTSASAHSSKTNWFSIIALICITGTNFAQVTTVRPASQKQNEQESNRLFDPDEFKGISNDLEVPPMLEQKPAPGKRVRQQLPAYRGTNVYHSLYLPTNYQQGSTKKYPVIFEYAGNGPYQNRLGDRCTGKVEDCSMGYGISAGKDFIWVCLPFVSKDRKQNQTKWWGEVAASVDYCKSAVSYAAQHYQVDKNRVFLCGFSRGAIACNYIGLHDREIASLWCGMICHSHYDGVRRWSYEDSDRPSAAKRLQRLGETPQLISQEKSTQATREFIVATKIKGDFTYLDLPFPNHTDQWLLKDIPQRKKLRRWVQQVLAEKN